MADDKLVRESVFKATVQAILNIIKKRKIPTTQLSETDNLKVLTSSERNKIGKIITTDDGCSYLSNDGEYKKIDADNIIDGSTNKIYTIKDKGKLDKIIIDGDGTKVLSDDGTYKKPDSVGIIDDKTISESMTYSSKNIEAKLTELDEEKSNIDHTHKELEQAHTHENKIVLDKINSILYGKIYKLVTEIIDPDKSGVGKKVLYDDYTFKELDIDGLDLSNLKSSPIDAVNEEQFSIKNIEEVLDDETTEIIKYLNLKYPIKVLTKAEYQALSDSSSINSNTIYITTESSDGIDIEGNIDVSKIILTNGDGTLYLTNDGTYKKIVIKTDTEMSDESENPVQNKIIKAYVDSKETVISEETGNQIITKEDGIYVPATSISSEKNNTIVTKSDGLYVPKSDVSISAESGNALEKKDDGLFVKESITDISKEDGNIIENKEDGLYATASVNVARSTLFDGSLVSGSITLADSIENYDYLEVNTRWKNDHCANTKHIIAIDDIVYDSSATSRFNGGVQYSSTILQNMLFFYFTDSSTISISYNGNGYNAIEIYKILGVKL